MCFSSVFPYGYVNNVGEQVASVTKHVYIQDLASRMMKKKEHQGDVHRDAEKQF